jgi:hypothetical protein
VQEFHACRQEILVQGLSAKGNASTFASYPAQEQRLM